MKKMLLQMCLILLSQYAFADKIVLLDSNDDSLQARADEIYQAQNTIRAQYFTVDNDSISRGALALLLDASIKNPKLKIQILVDSMHNFMTDETMAAILGNLNTVPTNIEIKEYNRFNLFKLFSYTKRMHDKALIIDDRVMIIGGRNIANGYFGRSASKGTEVLPVFEDSDSLIFESSSIQTATQYFDDLWNSKFVDVPRMYDFTKKSLEPSFCQVQGEIDQSQNCQSKQQKSIQSIKSEILNLQKFAVEYSQNKLAVSNSQINWLEKAVEVQSIEYLFDDVKTQKSNLDKPDSNIGSRLYSEIAKATENVVIVSPYMVITPEHESLFKQLREKNVQITLITNSKGSNDVPAAHLGFEKTRQKALDLGVKIFEYQGPDTLHAKMILIDHSILFIGSYNWDFRSQNLNREVGILARLPENNLNYLSIKVIRKFASFLKKSCRLGGSICHPDLKSENLSSLTDEQFNDLMEAFRVRQDAQPTIYKLLYPLIEGQL